MEFENGDLEKSSIPNGKGPSKIKQFDYGKEKGQFWEHPCVDPKVHLILLLIEVTLVAKLPKVLERSTRW